MASRHPGDASPRMIAASLHDILVVCIIAILAIAALHDIAVRTVPNGISAAVALLALVLRAFDHQLPGALLGFTLVFVVSFVFWLRGWIGGGDVKLMPAASLAVAPDCLARYIVAVSLAGGALALLYLALAPFVTLTKGSRPSRMLSRVLRTERWRIRGRRSLPYACAIAAGAMLTITRV
jgi:prepilin peptidase CpaA